MSTHPVYLLTKENRIALYNWLKTLLANEDGQDLIEYALIIVLIVLVVALALPFVATPVGGVFDNVSSPTGQLKHSGPENPIGVPS